MLGDLISAGLKLAGGLMGFEQQRHAENVRRDEIERQERNAQLNRDAQREYAQNAIAWRVADANRSGVHPLYALGASGTSFSPVSVGDGGSISSTSRAGEALGDMGQDISRAMGANASNIEKVAAVNTAQQLKSNELSLENAQLRNNLLKLQIARMQGGATVSPPPQEGEYNIPGQPNSGIKAKPLEVAPAPVTTPHQEAGSITDVGYSRTATGGYAPVPSKDVKERIEDVMPYEWSHWLRVAGAPNIGLLRPPFKAPSGKVWAWDYGEQAYHLRDSGGVDATRRAIRAWQRERR